MQKEMPKLLWISLISLGIMMLLNLTGGLIQMNYIIAGVGIIDGLLIWGITKGYRWAFWGTTVLVFGGLLYIAFTATIAPIILSVFFDSLLFVPVFIRRNYFFQ